MASAAIYVNSLTLTRRAISLPRTSIILNVKKHYPRISLGIFGWVSVPHARTYQLYPVNNLADRGTALLGKDARREMYVPDGAGHRRSR